MLQPVTRRLYQATSLTHLFFVVILYVLTTTISSKHVDAAPIPLTTAEVVANNLLSHLNSSHSVKDIELVESSNKHVGYLVQLLPEGYILIAGDDIRVPVKAYSLSSNFHLLPAAYTVTLLHELEIATTQLNKSSTPPEATNSTYWQYLRQTSMPSLKTYTPDTFLLTTQWGQGHPYNKLMPLLGDTRTLTGCTQTATAQLMRYHQYPATGNGVFTQSWNSQTYTAVMKRPFNWGIMPVSGFSGEVYEQDEIAALMRDIGVLNSASYGVSATSAYFHTTEFERAFGYAPIATMLSSDNDFFTTIKSEIDNLRPLLLSIPGHLTVADGYASDGSGKKIHVNMGWNGAYDDYYFLDQTIVTGSNSFPPNHTIYYNLKPCEGAGCQAPDPPQGNSVAPQINSLLEDVAISGSANMRIDGYDRDGDAVIFSAASSCNSLPVTMDDNILTLTPTTPDSYCRIRTLIQSHDGTAAKTFNVLTVADGTYVGSEYDISGKFADGTEIDTYRVYLDGPSTISGNRGYSNQAFYLWVKDDQNVTTVVNETDAMISYDFPSGYYTLSASFRSPTGWYYAYEADKSNYILSITTNVIIEEIAAGLGLVRLPGDVNGDDTVTLADTIICLSVLSDLTAVNDMAPADIDFDGKIGMAEVIYSLRSNAGL